MPTPIPITPAEFLTPLGFVTMPIRGAAAAYSALTSQPKEGAAKGGQKAFLGGKPVVFNAQANKWVPDLSTEAGKDAWRAAGTSATLGGQKVTWDPKEGWVSSGSRNADSQLPPPPPMDDYTGGNIDVSTAAPPAPQLPPPSPATFPESRNSPLETQKPDLDPKVPYEYAEKFIRDYFLPLRREEQVRELERSIVTAKLRDRGLQELSRRAIETETIKWWGNLAVARQNAMSNQAIALATTAYLSQIPSEAGIKALAEVTRSTMQPVAITSAGTVG